MAVLWTLSFPRRATRVLGHRSFLPNVLLLLHVLLLLLYVLLVLQVLLLLLLLLLLVVAVVLPFAFLFPCQVLRCHMQLRPAPRLHLRLRLVQRLNIRSTWLPPLPLPLAQGVLHVVRGGTGCSPWWGGGEVEVGVHPVAVGHVAARLHHLEAPTAHIVHNHGANVHWNMVHGVRTEVSTPPRVPVPDQVLVAGVTASNGTRDFKAHRSQHPRRRLPLVLCIAPYMVLVALLHVDGVDEGQDGGWICYQRRVAVAVLPRMAHTLAQCEQRAVADHAKERQHGIDLHKGVVRHANHVLHGWKPLLRGGNHVQVNKLKPERVARVVEHMHGRPHTTLPQARQLLGG